MPSVVRIGVVGCGDVLEVGYMEVINRLRCQGVADLVFACDLREDLRSLVKDRYGVSRFTTDYRELVESPHVDVVLVLTSMSSHARISQEALEAGKHVLVEKPMAVSLEEGWELVEAARGSPGFLVPAPHVILSPTYQIIARRIREGDIGRPLCARARYGWAGPWWATWFYEETGGALFDLAVYNLTSLTGLIGPVEQVAAMMGVAIPERVVNGQMIQVQAHDNAHVLLDFGKSVLGVVTTGFTIQQYRSPALEIYGSDGTIQMMGDDWNPDGYELWQNHVGGWQVYDETDPGWHWCDGLNHLVACVREGTTPLITPEHSFHVLEVMLRAQEASQDGRRRRIESTFSAPVFPERRPALPRYLVNDPSFCRSSTETGHR